MEPHSPIPYLLERAVEMGRMPFPMLVKELIRDMAQLGEVYREFGIKDAEPPPSS
jgi:type VI secretion system protein ImpA